MAKREIYDVCVIGSGPAGGVLSKELAEAGAKVILIEAGRKMLPEDFHFHAWPYELPKRTKPQPFYPREVTEASRADQADATRGTPQDPGRGTPRWCNGWR